MGFLFFIYYYQEMYYVYIIRNSIGAYYTGFTNKLKQRLQAHNGNKVRTTKNRGSWELVVFESCKRIEDAVKREKYWKSSGGRIRRNRIIATQETIPYEYKCPEPPV
jgi:putative endonuclease